MPLVTNEFTHVMEKRSDFELIEIVTKLRNDYNPEAVKAAEIEIEKRNLSIDQIELVKEEIKLKDKALEEKANKPLQTHWKVLTFAIPGILSLILAGTFKADGYDRRFKEAWRWTLYGLGFYFGLFMLIVLIEIL